MTDNRFDEINRDMVVLRTLADDHTRSILDIHAKLDGTFYNSLTCM